MPRADRKLPNYKINLHQARLRIIKFRILIINRSLVRHRRGRRYRGDQCSVPRTDP